MNAQELAAGFHSAVEGRKGSRLCWGPTEHAIEGAARVGWRLSDPAHLAVDGEALDTVVASPKLARKLFWRDWERTCESSFIEEWKGKHPEVIGWGEVPERGVM